MANFEIKNASTTSKILFLEEYLKKCSENNKDKGKDAKFEKINEDELVELIEDFDEKDETKDVEKALEAIFDIINKNKEDNLTNEELSEFEDILKEAGLTFSELLSLYDEDKLEEEVNNIASDELKDLDVEGFKSLVAKHPKLKEIIEEVGYDKFFDLIDSNNDNKIDKDEIKKVSKSDKDFNNLSLDDIKKLLKDNDIEIEDLSKKAKEEVEFEELKDKLREALGIKTNDNNIVNEAIPMETSYVPSSGGSVGGYSPSYSSGGSSYSPSSNGGATAGQGAAGAQDIDSQIKELESEKSTKTSELSTKNSDLKEALDGTDDAIKDKKTDMDEKEEEYKKLLEENAENDEVVKGYKEDLEENENKIKENEENIKNTELDLSKKEQEISSQKSLISGLKSEKNALDSALKSVKATKKTKNNESEITAKISELTSLIAKKDEEIEKEEGKLQTLEGEKGELEGKLDDYKTEKTTLENERDEIEKNIENSADEATKNALKEFQAARETFESSKEARVGEVKGEITNLETEITNLETKIQELEAAKIEQEHQISPWGQYNEERGQALANAANSLYGGVSSGGGYCATGVSQAISKAFGYSTSGNGCDYGNVLAGRSDWVEITDTIGSASELANLPAGAIVSWSPYNTSSLGRLYGHVYIADGQGHEISDFKSNITTYYADRGSEYRVFLPV